MTFLWQLIRFIIPNNIPDSPPKSHIMSAIGEPIFSNKNERYDVQKKISKIKLLKSPISFHLFFIFMLYFPSHILFYDTTIAHKSNA